jgi:hypothetical protein
LANGWRAVPNELRRDQDAPFGPLNIEETP